MKLKRIPYTFNSRWIKYLNVKKKTLKFLQGNSKIICTVNLGLEMITFCVCSNKILFFLSFTFYPGWCVSLDLAQACQPKGLWFDSPPGNMPGLWASSPVGGE